MKHLEDVLRDAMIGEPFLAGAQWCVTKDAALAGMTAVDVELKDAMWAVLEYFGPEGANKVSAHVLRSREARRYNKTDKGNSAIAQNLKDTSMCSERSRNNPQIWRMAEWLYNSFNHFRPPDFSKAWEPTRQHYYDKAVEFLNIIQYNAFTGPDNHTD